MIRLLRWGTFFVLVFIIVGVVVSYPTLRDRLIAPMLAAPSPTPRVAAGTPSSITLSSQTSSPTARPTMPATRATSAAALIIIEPTAPTPSSQPSLQADSAATPTLQSPQNSTAPTPQVIATTSLLPVSRVANRIIPVVQAPSSDEVTTDEIMTDAITTDAIATDAITTALTLTAPSIAATPTTPAAEPPTELITVTREGDSVMPALAVATAEVTPIVVTTVEVTPLPDTPMAASPLPAGPAANTDSPLYSGPDFTYAIVGQVTIGEPLAIIGWYTEGTWYLLADGLWLPGAVVDNAPLALPLVFPTVTPIPTPTPTITQTPLPTATPEGSATPTPTPTSLDAPVCDCSADAYDCLGNIFTNRGEAQQCFEYCFRQTGLDIHLLDPNLNGIACENLP